ncbi:Hypothetical predicted protein [Olea europaea subsp. europaea]|uniref:Alpha-carbonic anhydrase domain-containing protein n=1 Tax=Olea europaea subsp. europaea TaxID=158383 RepID=A0A8S0VPB5_OLEEU|nr:Hypothetical predicted protein [Olea europaea subsp. europaea]
MDFVPFAFPRFALVFSLRPSPQESFRAGRNQGDREKVRESIPRPNLGARQRTQENSLTVPRLASEFLENTSGTREASSCQSVGGAAPSNCDIFLFQRNVLSARAQPPRKRRTSLRGWVPSSKTKAPRALPRVNKTCAQSPRAGRAACLVRPGLEFEFEFEFGWAKKRPTRPEYWNINKHWRLCSAGRKQSPVNIRTDRLVFDHLLGPLEFDWQRAVGGANQLGSSASFRPHNHHHRQPATSSSADGQQHQQQQQGTIPGRLINSGRGVELWLERASPFDSPPAVAHNSVATTKSTQIDHSHQRPNNEQPGGPSAQYEQLILARGPLAYEYKLFKIELHSASAVNGAPPPVDDDDDDDEQKGDNPLAEAQVEKTPEARGGGGGGAHLPARTSEHLINGRPFEAEVQLHFYNKHLAPGGARDALRMANEQPLGSLFAVISVFIAPHDATGDNSQDSEAGPNSTGGEPLDFLLERLDELQGVAQTSTTTATRGHHELDLLLRRADLEALLVDTRQYVTYQGSMNRPPCAESVDWIILNKALKVRARKLARLFEIPPKSSPASLAENVRPAVPLNGRLLRTTISNLRGPASSNQQHRPVAHAGQAAKCALLAQDARQKIDFRARSLGDVASLAGARNGRKPSEAQEHGKLLNGRKRRPARRLLSLNFILGQPGRAFHASRGRSAGLMQSKHDYNAPWTLAAGPSSGSRMAPPPRGQIRTRALSLNSPGLPIKSRRAKVEYHLAACRPWQAGLGLWRAIVLSLGLLGRFVRGEALVRPLDSCSAWLIARKPRQA